MPEPQHWSKESVHDALLGLVLNASSLDDFLAGLARFCAEGISSGGDVLCGITVLRRHYPVTVASSGGRAQRIDEVQYGFDGGPCLSAAQDQLTVVVPDLRAEKRWPGYPPVLVAEGIGSVVSVPFLIKGEVKAALNVYSEAPAYFGETVIDRVEDHVRGASKALQLAVKVAHHVDTAEHLKAALESRTVIDLALGITMGRTGCTQDEAIQRLKSISRQRNMKLRDLATQIVVASGGTASTHFVM